MPADDSVPRRLLVVALGGNALSPPHSKDPGYDDERVRIRRTGVHLRALAAQGFRLLIVHGNGPQVGRLLRADTSPDTHNLDVHTAQTQGELGYLISRELPGSVALITRVEVSDATGAAVKAIGPVLMAPPETGDYMNSGEGYRLAVSSPIPVAIEELDSIRLLLDHFHVIAGGGGGVAVDAAGRPVAGVIDKDRTAALLATTLSAEGLILATDVDGVYRNFGTAAAQRIARLSVAEAQALLNEGSLGAGSMAPKVESAAAYARASKRTAVICGIDDLTGALTGTDGTRVIA